MKAILNISEPKKKVLDLKMVKAKAGRGMRIMQIGLFIPKLDLASISFPLLPSDILQVFPGSPSAFLTSKFSLFTPAFTALPVSCDRGLIAMDNLLFLQSKPGADCPFNPPGTQKSTQTKEFSKSTCDN